jgi:riboflavin kinase/FMN adenylyltransferase
VRVKLYNKIRSVAIGSFDGMHVAHRALSSRAESLVVIERQEGYPRLTPGYKRSWYCDKPMAFYLFEKVRSLSPEAFVTRLREDYPALERIVVGYDFRFGRGREGSLETLERCFDGVLEVIPEVTVEGISVHSRTIRELLGRGELALANRLLGRDYVIDGEPIRGQGLGSREFVPTINLAVEGYQLPAEGVYAGMTLVNGAHHPSVIFLGHRRSTDGSFAIESHLLARRIDAVGSSVKLTFVRRLRANRTFGDFAALKRQIEADIQAARAIVC